jgi:hypothetical protein
VVVFFTGVWSGGSVPVCSTYVTDVSTYYVSQSVDLFLNLCNGCNGCLRGPPSPEIQSRPSKTFDRSPEISGDHRPRRFNLDLRKPSIDLPKSPGTTVPGDSISTFANLRSISQNLRGPPSPEIQSRPSQTFDRSPKISGDHRPRRFNLDLRKPSIDLPKSPGTTVPGDSISTFENLRSISQNLREPPSPEIQSRPSKTFDRSPEISGDHRPRRFNLDLRKPSIDLPKSPGTTVPGDSISTFENLRSISQNLRGPPSPEIQSRPSKTFDRSPEISGDHVGSPTTSASK